MAEAQDTTRAGNPPDPGYRERYPWHAGNWTVLTRDFSRLPHALLLHGQEGLGKELFALRLAHTLVCAKPDAQAAACGECPSCLLFAAGTHPDLVVTKPIEDSAVITVDQVRTLGDFLALRPHTAARKIMILAPAQAMNQNAANALLKLLEEPPLGSVFLLVTAHVTRLPATIRSRCAPLVFRPPERSSARAWLAEHLETKDIEALLDGAAGAPLQALALASDEARSGRDGVTRDLEMLRVGEADPLASAARWKTLGTERCLRWAQDWAAETIRARMASGTKTNASETRHLFNFFDVLSNARYRATTPLDETLLLEDTLIYWYRLTNHDRLH